MRTGFISGEIELALVDLLTLLEADRHQPADRVLMVTVTSGVTVPSARKESRRPPRRIRATPTG